MHQYLSINAYFYISNAHRVAWTLLSQGLLAPASVALVALGLLRAGLAVLQLPNPALAATC